MPWVRKNALATRMRSSSCARAHRREALREQPVVRPRLLRGRRTSRRRTCRGRSRRSGRRRPRLRHRLRSRGGVRPPSSFHICAGRCSCDSLTISSAATVSRMARPRYPKIDRPAAAASASRDADGRAARGRDAEGLRRALAGGARDRPAARAPERGRGRVLALADARDRPVRGRDRRDGVVRDRVGRRQRRAAFAAGAPSPPRSPASSSTCRSRF